MKLDLKKQFCHEGTKTQSDENVTLIIRFSVSIEQKILL